MMWKKCNPARNRRVRAGGIGGLAADIRSPGAPARRGDRAGDQLPVEELRAFDALCESLGARSRSDGLRSVIRMASGFLEFSREDSVRLDEIRFELHKIGVNVNQIALAANRGRSAMVRSQWGAIEALRRELPSLRTALAQVISERRRRGTALFRQFVAEGEGRQNG